MGSLAIIWVLLWADRACQPHLCATRRSGVSGAINDLDPTDLGPTLKHVSDIDLFCDMTDLHGWSLGGFWAELKFDAKHAKDFRRVAVITGKPLHRFMASMLKPFTSAEIKCFQQAKKTDALTWISHN